MLVEKWKKALGAIVVSMSLTGCFPMGQDHVDEKDAIERDTKKIETLYKDKNRIKSIVLELNARCNSNLIEYTGSGYTSRYIKACADNREKYFKPLIEGDIKINLSENLTDNAVVKVFKDRIILNSFLAQDTQKMALKKTFDYMAEQKRDGLKYGIGEMFTIGHGELINRGKFGTFQKKFLMP